MQALHRVGDDVLGRQVVGQLNQVAPRRRVRPRQLQIARKRAAQATDETKAQHGGQRPDFADGQRSDVLIRVDQFGQRLERDARAGLHEDAGRHRINSGIAGLVVRCGQGGQLAIEAARHVFAHFTQGALDDVVVVEKPLGTVRDIRVVGRSSASILAVGLLNHRFAGGQPCQQRLRPIRVGGHILLSCRVAHGRKERRLSVCCLRRHSDPLHRASIGWRGMVDGGSLAGG